MLLYKVVASNQENRSLDQITKAIQVAKQGTCITITSSSEASDYVKQHLVGRDLNDLAVARTDNETLVALQLSEKAMALVRISLGGLIAFEYFGPKGERQNIAFRDDISHSRLCLFASVNARRDIVYKDASFVKGDTFRVDSLADVGISEPVKIHRIEPTWYTEDWLTIVFDNGARLVIRADHHTLKGFQSLIDGAFDTVCFGDRQMSIDDLRNKQLTYENANKV